MNWRFIIHYFRKVFHMKKIFRGGFLVFISCSVYAVNNTDLLVKLPNLVSTVTKNTPIPDNSYKEIIPSKRNGISYNLSTYRTFKYQGNNAFFIQRDDKIYVPAITHIYDNPMGKMLSWQKAHLNLNHGTSWALDKQNKTLVSYDNNTKTVVFLSVLQKMPLNSYVDTYTTVMFYKDNHNDVNLCFGPTSDSDIIVKYNNQLLVTISSYKESKTHVNCTMFMNLTAAPSASTKSAVIEANKLKSMYLDDYYSISAFYREL